MIEIFRRNLFINTLLVIPYLLLIRLVTLINPSFAYHDYKGSSILVSYLYEWLSMPIIQVIISIILILIQALMINSIGIKNRLAGEATLFGGIVFIILVSLSPSILSLTHIHFAILFMLLAMQNIFNTYKNSDAVGNIFASGFFISVAAIFHPPFIVFVLWGFISLMIIHSFKMKEKLQYFAGVGVAIYLLYGFVFYFSDGLKLAMSNFYKQLGTFHFSALSSESIIAISVYGMLFMIVFFSYNKYGLKKRVEVQKKIDIIFWYMIFCVPAIILTQNISLASLVIIAPAISLLLNLNMSQTNNKLMLEMIHLLFLGIIVYTQYFLS